VTPFAQREALRDEAWSGIVGVVEAKTLADLKTDGRAYMTVLNKNPKGVAQILREYLQGRAE
jgi:hypothetical protein